MSAVTIKVIANILLSHNGKTVRLLFNNANSFDDSYVIDLKEIIASSVRTCYTKHL